MVKEFAKEEDLTYVEFGFVSGNQQVIGVLREVAGLVDQVKIVAKVANVEAKEAVDKKIAQQEAGFSRSRSPNAM